MPVLAAGAKNISIPAKLTAALTRRIQRHPHKLVFDKVVVEVAVSNGFRSVRQRTAGLALILVVVLSVGLEAYPQVTTKHRLNLTLRAGRLKGAVRAKVFEVVLGHKRGISQVNF